MGMITNANKSAYNEMTMKELKEALEQCQKDKEEISDPIYVKSEIAEIKKLVRQKNNEKKLRDKKSAIRISNTRAWMDTHFIENIFDMCGNLDLFEYDGLRVPDGGLQVFLDMPEEERNDEINGYLEAINEKSLELKEKLDESREENQKLKEQVILLQSKYIALSDSLWDN